jgi:hypothetical protein
MTDNSILARAKALLDGQRWHSPGEQVAWINNARHIFRDIIAALEGPNGSSPGLMQALRAQDQLDEDGVVVGVSRQAVEEAADLIERQRLRLADLRLAVETLIAAHNAAELRRAEAEDKLREATTTNKPLKWEFWP